MWALGAYFADHQFWEYFGNIVGRIRFTLPGVFLDNPVAGMVNVNLWTLAPEFYCYLITGAAMAFGLFYNRTLFLILFVASTLGLIIANTAYGTSISATVYPGHVMVYYFFAGCFVYFWKHDIPFGPIWFIASAVAAYFLLLSPRTIFLAPLFLTYATVCIGLLPIPRIPLLQNGDYSYGIYLYGFPIAQALAPFTPNFAGTAGN